MRDLSRRQLEAIRLAADGMTNPEIAERMGIGPESVKTHLHQAYGKLGACNRTHAVRLARERGIIN